MAGTLYVVATPIGNLEDLSPRALRVLREAAVIAAEDTRVTRKLLARWDLHTPLTSFHAHSGEARVGQLVDRLLAGEDVALVSDAGTPGVSDPGGALVRAAVEAGIVVVPVPGPSAVVTALSASGLDPSRFLFEGFLPRSRGDQKRSLRPLRALSHTLVFYEAPGRVAATLRVLAEELGDREAVVAREITKKFEEFSRGTLTELSRRLEETPPRGECVILVAGSGGEVPDAEPAEAESPEEFLRSQLAAGISVRDAARAATERFQRPRREMYGLAQQLTEEGG